ncbi:hypothetical protein [uncultured Vagococcus sp.]|uniref:hypothetical protein n=1 Tax=uncultured Vagococcus sp. TaxID=189676 RepID=UPI0028D057B4|nr:hypothetical protein [uncultured Vagococcus sp.]
MTSEEKERLMSAVDISLLSLGSSQNMYDENNVFYKEENELEAESSTDSSSQQTSTTNGETSESIIEQTTETMIVAFTFIRFN